MKKVESLLLLSGLGVFFGNLFLPGSVQAEYDKIAFIVILLALVRATGVKPDLLDACMLGCVLLAVPSFFVAPDSFKAFLSIYDLAFAVTLLIFFRRYCSVPSRRRSFLVCVFLYTLYLALSCHQVFLHNLSVAGFSNALLQNSHVPGYHPNILSMVLNVGLVLSIMLYAGTRNPALKFLLAAGMCAVGGAVFLTLSKAGLLLLFLNLCFFLKRCCSMKTVHILILCLLLLGIPARVEVVRDRFGQLISTGYYMDRPVLFAEGARIAGEHLLFGAGGNNFGYLSRPFARKDVFQRQYSGGAYAHCHNALLELLLSYGVFFFAAFLCSMYLVVKYTPSQDGIRSFLILFVSVVLLNSMVENVLFQSQGAFILFSVAGSFCILRAVPGRKWAIAAVVFINLWGLVFIYFAMQYSQAGVLLEKANATPEMEQKIQFLGKASEKLPFSADIYRYLYLFKVFSNQIESAGNDLRKGMKYGRYDLEMWLFSAWQQVFTSGDHERELRKAFTVSPDDEGLISLTGGLTNYYQGNMESAAAYFARYLIRYPAFIRDVFFTVNQTFREQVILILKDEDFQNTMCLVSHDENYLFLRLAEVFYRAGLQRESREMFRKVHPERVKEKSGFFNLVSRLEFLKEFEAVRYVLTGNEKGIDWKACDGSIELPNKVVHDAYTRGDDQKVLKLIEKYYARRKPAAPGTYSEELPEGLFFGVLSAVRSGDVDKGIALSLALTDNPDLNYLGCLGLSLCRSKDWKASLQMLFEALGELGKKKHLFHRHRSTIVFTSRKPDWIPESFVPPGMWDGFKYLSHYFRFRAENIFKTQI